MIAVGSRQYGLSRPLGGLWETNTSKVIIRQQPFKEEKRQMLLLLFLRILPIDQNLGSAKKQKEKGRKKKILPYSQFHPLFGSLNNNKKKTLKFIPTHTLNIRIPRRHSSTGSRKKHRWAVGLLHPDDPVPVISLTTSKTLGSTVPYQACKRKYLY